MSGPPTDVHRVRQVITDPMGVTLPDPYVECERCGKRWPIDADLFLLSRSRCRGARP